MYNSGSCTILVYVYRSWFMCSVVDVITVPPYNVPAGLNAIFWLGSKRTIAVENKGVVKMCRLEGELIFSGGV